IGVHHRRGTRHHHRAAGHHSAETYAGQAYKAKLSHDSSRLVGPAGITRPVLPFVLPFGGFEVRFWPKADLSHDPRAFPLRANKDSCSAARKDRYPHDSQDLQPSARSKERLTLIEIIPAPWRAVATFF